MADILQDAINLVKQGKKHEARGMLEVLLRTNPQDVSAWFWYAETLDTLEKRVKVLELCLKANPGNPQAEKALAMMRTRLSEASPPPAPVETKPAFDWNSKPAAFTEPEANATESESAFDWKDNEKSQSRSSAILWDEESQAEAAAPINWDDEPETKTSSTIDWDSIEQQQAPKPEAWQYEPGPDALKVEPPAAPARSYPFYKVWFTALFNQSVSAYKELLDDPKAGIGRAIEWTLYPAFISGALGAFFFLTLLKIILAESTFKSLIDAFFGNMSQTQLLIFIIVTFFILTPISSIINLAYLSGLQNLIAKMRNGKGSFSRTVYAMAIYQAPGQLLLQLIVVAPITLLLISSGIPTSPDWFPVLWCLSPIITIYAIILNIRALQAAQRIGTIDAIIILVITFVAQLVISGCLNFVLSSVIGSAGESFLPNLIPFSTPSY